MNELPDRETTQQALQRIDPLTADRIAWVIEQIADGGFTVGQPGMPWAGFAEVVKRAAAEFRIEAPDAERLVNLAHADLWYGARSSAGQAERRLLTARLNVIRRVILQAIKAPKKTTTFLFKARKGADGKTVMVKVPKRESIREGFDINAVRLLIDIERMIVSLNDLSTEGNGELVAAIFKELEKDSNGQTKETVTASISQKVKNMDLSKLSSAGQEIVEQALAQERKAIKSQPVGEAKANEKARDGSSGGLRSGDRGPDAAGGLEVPH